MEEIRTIDSGLSIDGCGTTPTAPLDHSGVHVRCDHDQDEGRRTSVQS